MSELSVVMPMYRAKYIGWLPFESLIRQKDINFEWELIVAEETEEQLFGKKNILEYKHKLKKLGCVNFKYIGLNKWIPLAEKIHLLVNNCHLDSKIFVWHSADYYSAPLRLATHHDVFTNNPDIDLHLPKRAIYYYINDDKFIIHDPHYDQDKRRRINDVVGKSYKLDIIREIPKVKQRQGVDGWLFRQATKISENRKGRDLYIQFDETDNWKFGLSTHGLNNICVLRTKNMKNPVPPFYEHVFDETTVPTKIIKRLRECRKFAKKHKIGLRARGK